MMSRLGNTLLIANPAAQNGNGAAAAAHAATLLGAELGERFELVLTEAPGHAAKLAAAAGAYDTVVALGGDGVVHEIAGGLMTLPQADRPTLGLVPVGSGNDYARTLKMSTSVDQAVRQLLSAEVRQVDVGCCNGEYFVQTLSFGLDAAIALDTVERRKRTGKTGTLLYLSAGIDQLLHHLDTYQFTAQLDDGTVLSGESFIFAVQIGQTYGGGFRLCPEARIDDGLFDLCIARPPLSVPYATLIFLLAKNGHHTRFKQLSFYRTASLHLSFDRRPPVQMDGEPHLADAYDISLEPRALSVLMAQGARAS